MKKSCVFSVFFTLFLFLISLAQSPQKVDLLYNESKFEAYIINNVSFISREYLSYIIGKPVKWDSKEKVVIIDNIRIYSKVVIYKGNLLISLKETLTPLGYQVKWNQYSRTITIIPPSSNKEDYKANVKVEKSNSEGNLEEKMDDTNRKNSKKSKRGDSNNYEIPNVDNLDASKDASKRGQSLQIVFIPRSAFNEEYKVTVSDLKESKVYKGIYNSQAGYKFIIVSVSQQNLSNKVQLYTGKFVLFDNRNVRYEYIEGLSSYVLQILMPMGINFGTLVFEIPETSIPSKLILETYGSTPIIVNLL